MNLLVILFILTYFVFDSNLSRATTAERCFKKINALLTEHYLLLMEAKNRFWTNSAINQSEKLRVKIILQDIFKNCFV